MEYRSNINLAIKKIMPLLDQTGPDTEQGTGQGKSKGRVKEKENGRERGRSQKKGITKQHTSPANTPTRSPQAFRVALLLLLALPQIAFAALFENLLTFNPKALALGNAVSADYVGIDSLQYNPAALIHMNPGISADFRLLGAPVVQTIRQTSPTLSPQFPEFTLYYRGYTVRCDSAFKPFAGLTGPNGQSLHPNDQLTPSVLPTRSFNDSLPADVCFGPELTNPNGVFVKDPLNKPAPDLSRPIAIPIPLPFALPNIGYKPYEDSRFAFAAQIFSTAPLPPIDFGESVDLINTLGVQRFTFSPGFAFAVTDKLNIGAAMRISKSYLQTDIFISGQNQLVGFLNATTHDLCTTNQTRSSAGEQFIFDTMYECASLYRNHQARVDAGEARESGYWPFLPQEPIATVQLEGDTPLGYGWNIGVQWSPSEWLTLGSTYRSEEDDVYRTKGNVYYSDGLLSVVNAMNNLPVLGPISQALILNGSASDKINIDLNIPWPAAFSLGASIRVFTPLKFNVEYRKYYYSAWDFWDATIVGTEVKAISLLGLLSPNNVGNVLPIEAGGEDLSYYSYGLEYQLNRRLALRLGNEERPFLNDSGEATLLAINGITMRSLGAAYHLTHNQIVDVSLTHMAVDAGPSEHSLPLSEQPMTVLTLRGATYEPIDLKINVLLFTASYTYRF